MTRIARLVRHVAAVLFLSTLALAQSLTVIGWNVESGGAAAATVAERIKAIDGCDIWGLSEVRNEDWARSFRTAAGHGESANFRYVLGTTGGSDRLVVIYNSDRFDLVSKDELHQINFRRRDGRFNVRSPLVVRLKEKTTNKEFLFMVNHLYRSNAGNRHIQGEKLNDWARVQSLPVVATGDYNYDWSLPMSDGETDHDQGYDRMIKDGVWKWVRPSNPIKTQASRHNSILDFVFVAGSARSWTTNDSTILTKTGDFPDDNTTPDHRPVRVTFDVGKASSSGPTAAELETIRTELRATIQRLEAELAKLKMLLEKLG